jgi:hypothetical protein
MQVGFYTVLRRDPQHFLHAVALVQSIQQHMPGVAIHQFTDQQTPVAMEGVEVHRMADGPMLERRLEHYATCDGDWLLLDTDTVCLQDARSVFDDPLFEIALTDRNWKGIPQGEEMLLTMPFNTGVVFSRSAAFWQDVLTGWRTFPAEAKDWYSEQRAVYQIVRMGKYRIKILPGEIYNYPPRTKMDSCQGAVIAHFKGPKKQWLTELIRESWRVPTSV